jgi:hypothetical protein
VAHVWNLYSYPSRVSPNEKNYFPQTLSLERSRTGGPQHSHKAEYACDKIVSPFTDIENAQV